METTIPGDFVSYSKISDDWSTFITFYPTGGINVYTQSANNWELTSTISPGVPIGDGKNLDINYDGTIISISQSYFDSGLGSYQGVAKVFRFENGSWNQMGSDIVGTAESDFFGKASSLSNDGLTIAIGGSYGDASTDYLNDVRIYRFVENSAGLSNWQPDAGSTLVLNTGDSQGLVNFYISNDGNRLTAGTNIPEFANSTYLHDRIMTFDISNNSLSQINSTDINKFIYTGFNGIMEQNGTIVFIERLSNENPSGTVATNFFSFIFTPN